MVSRLCLDSDFFADSDLDLDSSAGDSRIDSDSTVVTELQYWLRQTFMVSVFYSSKFSSKIKYVNSLQELGEIIPMEFVHIPPSIVKWVHLLTFTFWWSHKVKTKTHFTLVWKQFVCIYVIILKAYNTI